MKLLSFVSTLALCLTISDAIEKDKHDSCKTWADSGECESNAGYMMINCAASCDLVEKEAAAADDELARITSFYDLKANDIDGVSVDFEQFRGQVVILTNVASFCGYTESHYLGLVELWSHVKDEEVEVLAFPCNQFGKQEPGTPAEIKAFAKEQGVKFRMMEKINVNGASADTVYKYLKKEAGPKTISWNFATYFVVGPDGHVQSFSGVKPMELKDVALGMLREEL